MLPFSLVQHRLRLVDGLLQVFALFLPGGLFPRWLAIAALLLPFVATAAFRSTALSAGREEVFFGLRPAGLRAALDGRAVASPRFVGSSDCSLKGRGPERFRS
jgi:hypothetical protein